MSRAAARTAAPATSLSAGLLSLLLVAIYSDTAAAADSSDQRSRIVESSLKDLSIANDTAIARQRLEPATGVDALGNTRVTLEPRPLPDSQQRVEREAQSSLHRLRRETVSAQTEDGRKARVDESLDRTARSDP